MHALTKNESETKVYTWHGLYLLAMYNLWRIAVSCLPLLCLFVHRQNTGLSSKWNSGISHPKLTLKLLHQHRLFSWLRIYERVMVKCESIAIKPCNYFKTRISSQLIKSERSKVKELVHSRKVRLIYTF